MDFIETQKIILIKTHIFYSHRLKNMLLTIVLSLARSHILCSIEISSKNPNIFFRLLYQEIILIKTTITNGNRLKNMS